MPLGRVPKWEKGKPLEAAERWTDPGPKQQPRKDLDAGGGRSTRGADTAQETGKQGTDPGQGRATDPGASHREGQQEIGEESRYLGDEGSRTERRQAIFLRTKLRHIIRALQIEDHKTEEPQAGLAGGDTLQDRGTAGREQNVLKDREQEPHGPGIPRITPRHDLQRRLPEVGQC